MIFQVINQQSGCFLPYGLLHFFHPPTFPQKFYRFRLAKKNFVITETAFSTSFFRYGAFYFAFKIFNILTFYQRYHCSELSIPVAAILHLKKQFVDIFSELHSSPAYLAE